jgi:hypothetical protein
LLMLSSSAGERAAVRPAAVLEASKSTAFTCQQAPYRLSWERAVRPITQATVPALTRSLARAAAAVAIPVETAATADAAAVPGTTREPSQETALRVRALSAARTQAKAAVAAAGHLPLVALEYPPQVESAERELHQASRDPLSPTAAVAVEEVIPLERLEALEAAAQGAAAAMEPQEP